MPSALSAQSLVSVVSVSFMAAVSVTSSFFHPPRCRPGRARCGGVARAPRLGRGPGELLRADCYLMGTRTSNTLQLAWSSTTSRMADRSGTGSCASAAAGEQDNQVGSDGCGHRADL